MAVHAKRYSNKIVTATFLLGPKTAATSRQGLHGWHYHYNPCSVKVGSEATGQNGNISQDIKSMKSLVWWSDWGNVTLKCGVCCIKYTSIQINVMSFMVDLSFKLHGTVLLYEHCLIISLSVYLSDCSISAIW